MVIFLSYVVRHVDYRIGMYPSSFKMLYKVQEYRDGGESSQDEVRMIKNSDSIPKKCNSKSLFFFIFFSRIRTLF